MFHPHQAAYCLSFAIDSILFVSSYIFNLTPKGLNWVNFSGALLSLEPHEPYFPGWTVITCLLKQTVNARWIVVGVTVMLTG